ncbi:MAG TPA: SH3 domain-containing protein, partial [Thermomicrobiales bacterium]|nr:SH3 domain-containing protein [Thermomicrobiales bacterium]
EPTEEPTATPEVGTVTGTNGFALNCRAEPNADAEILTAFAPYTVLDLTGEEEDGWYPVRCGDEDGYVSADYITLGEVTPTPVPTATVATNGQPAACRSDANNGSGIIASVPNGTVLTVRGASSNGFVPVVCDGLDGWITDDLLS